MKIEFIKDIVQILFYVTTSFVACVGLQQWRKELKGKVEYETAKQALAKAYSVRDQLRIVQSPLMSSLEYEERDLLEDENKHQREVNESLFAYNKRFQKLQDKVFEMYPIMIEAEALYGTEAREALEQLISATRKLRAAINAYHRGLYKRSPDNEVYYNIIFNVNEVEHPELKPLDDNFRIELDATLQKIQEYFVPKLGRKTPML